MDPEAQRKIVEAVDPDNWEYARGWDQPFHRMFKHGDSVRRKRWHRVAVASPWHAEIFNEEEEEFEDVEEDGGEGPVITEVCLVLMVGVCVYALLLLALD